MEDHYQETFETWNKLAELYQEHFMDLDIYDQTYDEFCDLLPNSDAQILELGCGPGNITRQLLNRMPKLKITATDVSEQMIKLAKQNNPEAEHQILDCRNMSSLNKKFDAIICGFTIPYLSKLDVDRLIADSSALLNPNGICYLSFVPGNPNQSGYITGSTGDRSYFYYHEEKKIKDRLIFHGYKVVYDKSIAFKRSNGLKEYHKILIVKLQ